MRSVRTMVSIWKMVTLSAALASDAVFGEQCKRREEADWPGFQRVAGDSGFGREDGIATLAADVRTGVHRLPEPHAYAIIGGGQWGPRVVAKMLLESVLVDWSNDVLLLDMMQEETDDEGNSKRIFWGSDSGLQEAQTRLSGHLCQAILRCPGKAAVVLDNVHSLQGEDIRVLDTMLSLLDGAKSNMDCGDVKVSGEGSLFLLLLNEEGSEETKRLKGKERLLEAWKFKGLEFTTSAFVGRMDAAVSLSKEPRQLEAGMEDAWDKARAWPPADDGGIRKTLQDVWKKVGRIVRENRNLAAAGAATVTMLVVGNWYSRKNHAPGKIGDAGKAAGGTTVGSRNPKNEGNGGKFNGPSAKDEAIRARGGGREGGPASATNGGPRGAANGEGKEGGEAVAGSGDGAKGAGVSQTAACGADSERSGNQHGEPTAAAAAAAAVDAAAETPVAMSTRSRGRRFSAQTGTSSSRSGSKSRRRSSSGGTRSRRRSARSTDNAPGGEGSR